MLNPNEAPYSTRLLIVTRGRESKPKDVGIKQCVRSQSIFNSMNHLLDQSFSQIEFWNSATNSWGTITMFAIPSPPPLVEALIITGQPISLETSKAWSKLKKNNQYSYLRGTTIRISKSYVMTHFL